MEEVLKVDVRWESAKGPWTKEIKALGKIDTYLDVHLQDWIWKINKTIMSLH